MSLLPEFLIQALFGLGGVCFILCITTFHYFNEKVNEYLLDKMRSLFSSSTTDEFLETIRDGTLPALVMKDFMEDLYKIVKPRRRLRSLLLFFPLSGCLFIFSASLASLSLIENELVMSIGTFLEFLADSILLIAFTLVIYCAFHLVKLARELA